MTWTHVMHDLVPFAIGFLTCSTLVTGRALWKRIAARRQWQREWEQRSRQWESFCQNDEREERFR